MNHSEEASTVCRLIFTVHIFKEGNAFVAYAPDLDLSSCGDTPDEARKNISDAVRGFLETCEEMGTLNEILEEAGYQHESNNWTPPEFVSLDRLTLSFKS
jgi:predicted RNase H-like HicB family nuclease